MAYSVPPRRSQLVPANKLHHAEASLRADLSLLNTIPDGITVLLSTQTSLFQRTSEKGCRSERHTDRDTEIDGDSETWTSYFRINKFHKYLLAPEYKFWAILP
jgi:hypothetical protein